LTAQIQPPGRLLDTLMVDSDPVSRRFLRRLLAPLCDLREVARVEDALLAMELRAPRMLVTRLHLPDGGAQRLLALASEAHPNVLRVVVSDSRPERLSINWRATRIDRA
jgi:DNA-binding NtrC family response regulator